MQWKHLVRDPRFTISLCIGLFGVSALLMWWPALHTPFWGDDYVFLRSAHAANAASTPWWSAFWPAHPLKFWRPLSQEAYWRLVDAVLGDHAHAMHVLSLLLHMLASLGVALLAWVIGRTGNVSRPRATAALTGVVYFGLAMHLLPVHWAAAANNSMLTLFTTLCLAAWLGAAGTHGWRRWGLLFAVPLCLVLALLSKESAVLTVLLMVLVRTYAGPLAVRRGEVVSFLACVAVSVLWLVLHARFTADTDPAYRLELGTNVVRNAVAFAAWMANVPREALRMAVTGDRPLALAWIAATALPMGLAAFLGFWRGRARLRPRQWWSIVLFAGLAYGPYFLLAWNSYAYYAAIAVILPVIALAQCSIDHPRLWLMLGLIAFSSWLAVAGTRHLDHPGLIGRARWAESMLQDLQHRHVQAPLWVEVADSHRFYAVGKAGLAWRLGIPASRIHIAGTCPDHVNCLRIDAQGRWHLTHAGQR